MVANFLETNYDKFFENYQKLLHSENYVTRRQSLKLLGELLLDRYNFTVMTKYISNPDNLKLMMNMLREKSRNIQFEAFHVFKVNSYFFYLFSLIYNKEKRSIKFTSAFFNKIDPNYLFSLLKMTSYKYHSGIIHFKLNKKSIYILN